MPRYRKPDEKKYALGEWYLDQRAGSPAWYRCRYLADCRQIERVSLRTADFAEAKRTFEDWYFAQHRPRQADDRDITLARVLTLYYQEYAKAIPSGRIVPEHMRIWLEFWQAATLAEMTLDRQVQFRAWLATERRYANSTIKRILTTGAAAVNRAWKTGIIRYPVKIIEVEGSTEAKEPRGRALTPGEIAKLFDAIEQEPLFRYCLILLATYCRAEPPHDLRGAGLDFRHRLIFLNPRGRPQNKKYRPTVKMPWFIAEHFAGIGPDDYLLTGTPTPVKDLKKGFYLAVERAGLEGKVTRTSFRHTGGRWLRAQGVKPWEAGAQLGHRKVYGSTTETYAPYDPAYLDSALCAIEQLFDAVRAESVSLQARFGEESKVVRLR